MSELRIAFGCEARVGKDTAVNYLIDKYGGDKLSFAEPIYDILNYAQTKTKFKKEKDREFLQLVGTWGRNRDPDVWVNCLLRRINEISTDTNIFISDVRFPNESKALQKIGFTCVRLNRDTDPSEFGSGSIKHISEVALISYPWDKTIQNNGTPSELYSELDLLVSKEV